MIGCKVMRTLASVEIKIIMILGLLCCLSSSSMRCLENVVVPVRMSTLVFVDPGISTQANGAQSSRVPIPLPEDPYEAISTPPTCHVEESEGSDTSGARSTSSDSTAPLSPDHPLNHTTPTLVPILRRTARMAVHVPPAMSPELSASIAEVAAMSDLEFRKRFRYSYESTPSSSPPDLPLRKHYRDSDSKSEDAEDEGPNAVDEDPFTGDKGLAAGDEDPGIGVESLGLGGDEVVPEGQQRAAPIVETAMGEPLGFGYGALRRQEIALGEGWMLSVFEVGQGSRSVPESERPERVSALSTLYCSFTYFIPMISLTVPSPVASPTTDEAEGFLTDLGAQVKMHEGLIRDHMVRLGELSPALLKRSLKHEQERVAVTFGAIWRPVLALESWAGQTDAHRAALWHAISDTQMENRELRLEIAEERRVRLDLAEVVDSMRRGQEPRGDV
ncbi:hypothetical protein Tco_0455494 [Tanacetum coccineum]